MSVDQDMDMAWSHALGWAGPKAALERRIPEQEVTVGGSTGWES